MSDKILEDAFANLLSDMLHTAMEDRKITEDEIAILSFVQDQVEEYKYILAESLQRDPESLNTLVHNALERLIGEAVSIAKQDNVISDDEIKLLRDLILFDERYQ